MNYGSDMIISYIFFKKDLSIEYILYVWPCNFQKQISSETVIDEPHRVSRQLDIINVITSTQKYQDLS